MKIFRDDKRYKVIEQIKDYELTPCVAFELAIRNTTVQRAAIEYYFIVNNDDYKPVDIFFEDKVFLSAFLSYYKISSKKEFLKKFHELVMLQHYYIDLPAIIKYKDVMDFIFMSYSSKKNISLDYEYKEEDVDEDDLFPCEDDNEYEEETKEKKLGHNAIGLLEKSVLYGNFNHCNLYEDGRNDIFQKFSRPTLETDHVRKADINLHKLNINIPKEEFLKYIESIYDYYQEYRPISHGQSIDQCQEYFSFEDVEILYKNSFYKFFETNLDDTEFDEVDEKYFIENMSEVLEKRLSTLFDKLKFDGVEICKTNKNNRAIKQSENFADCFFIYDFRTHSKTIKGKPESQRSTALEISKQLNEYYKSHSMERDAINTRHNIMKNLIERRYYKTMITG